MLNWAPYWGVDGVVLEEWARCPVSGAEYVIDRQDCVVWERWGGGLRFQVAGSTRTWTQARTMAEDMARRRKMRGAA